MLMQFYAVISLSCFCKLNKNGRVRPSPLPFIDGSEQIFAPLGNSLYFHSYFVQKLSSAGSRQLSITYGACVKYIVSYRIVTIIQ